MPRLLVIALLVLAGCGEAAPAGREAPAADGDGCAAAAAGARDCVLRVAGSERRYLLTAPAGEAPVPLIVALHGVGGPAADPAATREASGLDALGVAVAYADGEGTWDEARDDPYFEALLDDVTRRRAVDPRRVYVIGWSGGGFMAHRVACRLAPRVAAVAVLHAPLRGACAPRAPVSVLQIVGAEDPFIPVAGGKTPDGTQSPPVAEATARWRALNRCAPAKTSTADGVREVRASCAAGTTVTLVTLADGEHVWFPDATERAWRFFKAARRT